MAADEKNRDDRGMETGSRERSRAETQGDGDKRSLADDKLRPASDRDPGSRHAGSGSQADRAQELPREDVHKINHGDKHDAIIPRGTDEHSGRSGGDDESR